MWEIYANDKWSKRLVEPGGFAMDPGSDELLVEEPQIGTLSSAFFGHQQTEWSSNFPTGDGASIISDASGETVGTPVLVDESEIAADDIIDPNPCPSVDGFLHGLGLEGVDHDVVSSCHWESVEYEPSFSGLAEQPPQLAADYDADRVVDSAWKNLQSHGLKHFWEDSFWESFLDDKVEPVDVLTKSVKRPCPPLMASDPDTDDVIEQRISKRVASSTGPEFLRVVKDTPEQTWQEERDAKWETSIRRWVSLIDSWNGSSRIAKLIQDKSDFRDKAQILVDIFFNKAPQTLAKRVNSLGRITNYMLMNGRSFPCDEDDFYNFVKSEARDQAPVSRLKAYYEAITFARHVLNVESLQEILDSRRCLGAASTRELTVPNQSLPFTVKQLLAIHHELEHSSEIWTRNMCGMLLFCVYARARWSDAQHADKIVLDEDEQGRLSYIEIQTSNHKTCRALHMRHTFLPMTAPALGVSEVPWGPLWVKARTELGITDIKQFPLMPSPNKELIPTKRPLSTSEANGWIKLILQLGDRATSGKVTTHSCKCTALSYLAKRGVSIEDRLCLGYHSNPMRIALVYSRDSASRPLAVLEALLAEVRENKFQPDNTRSGRLRTGTPEFQGAFTAATREKVSGNICKVEHPQKVDAVIDLVSSDDGYATTSSSESSGDEHCVVAPMVGHRTVDIPETHGVWRNTSTKMFHLSLIENSSVLSCGRLITSNIVRVEEPLRFDACKCKQCFRQLKS